MLTFVIRNPKNDIVWLNNKSPKRGHIWPRLSKPCFIS
jgi:hypothetical protein